MTTHALEGSRGHEKTPDRRWARMATILGRLAQGPCWPAPPASPRPELLECSSYASSGPIYVQLKSLYPTVVEGGHTDR
jgi:hypothetical protein